MTAGFARRHRVLIGALFVASPVGLGRRWTISCQIGGRGRQYARYRRHNQGRLEPGTSLRGLAEKFLNDPDLWPIILRLNGISNIADIRKARNCCFRQPGSAGHNRARRLAREIQKANEAGAQLFAPILIKNAIDFRDQAMVENNNGVFQQSIALSSKSISTAGEARTTSEQKRDVEAEARLSDRQGWVEGQKVSENSWSERERDAVLNEQEKLRTLSASTAQVVFRDASRLRLNPNSQAVIQRMRDDPLKRREEAQISLVEGDFYALLAPGSDRSRLEVKLANVDAKIDSGNFWVSQDDSGAKFSNFDSKPVAIVSGEDTLVLGRNEGADRQAGRGPEGKGRSHRPCHAESRRTTTQSCPAATCGSPGRRSRTGMAIGSRSPSIPASTG